MAWDYDKEEEHLDEMSEKGWQLKKGGCFFSVYTRQPGVVYRNRIDYNPDAVNSPEEKRRYLELFEEQGWEYVGNTYNGWIYFKKKYVPGTPEEDYEIYTDAESLQSLLDRWKRLGIFTERAPACAYRNLYGHGPLGADIIILYSSHFMLCCWFGFNGECAG